MLCGISLQSYYRCNYVIENVFRIESAQTQSHTHTHSFPSSDDRTLVAIARLNGHNKNCNLQALHKFHSLHSIEKRCLISRFSLVTREYSAERICLNRNAHRIYHRIQYTLDACAEIGRETSFGSGLSHLLRVTSTNTSECQMKCAHKK